KDYANEARWKAVLELSRALSKHAEKVGATVPNILDQDWLGMGETTACPAPAGNAARVRVDGGQPTLNSLRNFRLVSSGTLEGTNSVDRCILFVDGDIKRLNSTANSVLICSGTIKSFNSTRNCIIFCNGEISQMNHTDSNAIFVRGELRSLNH